MKDIHDVIKHAKFGDDRLRGSGVVAGQISAFPIDFVGRPYNTLTLPCERVIINMSNGAVFKIYWSKIRNSTETNVLQTSSSNKYEFHSHKKTTTKINHVHDYTVD